MRILSLLFTGIILSSFTGKMNNDTSLNKCHLKGNVKSITDSAFVSVLADKVYAVRTCTFDKAGNLLSENMRVIGVDSFATSSSTFEHTYEYNAQDYVSEQDDYNKDGSISWRTFFTYGDHGHLKESRRYNNIGILYQRDVFEYNSKDNKQVEKNYDGGGAYTGGNLYIYDGHNNLVKIVMGDTIADRENKNIGTFQYDGKDRLTESYSTQSVDEEHTLINRSVYTDFDKAGNCIAWAEVNGTDKGGDTTSFKRNISYY